MSILYRAGLCLLLLLSAGCGSARRSEPVARLEGKVTINGGPLPEDAVGSVVFMPQAKGQAPAAQAKIVAGRYETGKAPLGDITAIFHISRPTGKIIKDSPDDEHPHPELQDLVPEELRAGVDLSVTGDNPHQDFDLK
jgi:hypothetical protein